MSVGLRVAAFVFYDAFFLVIIGDVCAAWLNRPDAFYCLSFFGDGLTVDSLTHSLSK
jgi:hypothetical protein